MHTIDEIESTIDMDRIVYVKEVKLTDLPQALVENSPFDKTQPLYMICSAEGVPMSVVDNRAVAFSGARQYNLEPLSVH